MLGKSAKAIIEAIKPSGFLDCRGYLSEVYQALKSYSYVTFTKEMGLGNCNAMLLINSKRRPVTLNNAKKVVAIGLRFGGRNYFF